MLVGSQPRRVAVIGGVRIPFARANSAYASVGNQEMLTASLKAVVERFSLRGQRLGDGGWLRSRGLEIHHRLASGL